MEKAGNWTKEEEYTLIEKIQSAGVLLRGYSADLNKWKKSTVE